MQDNRKEYYLAMHFLTSLNFNAKEIIPLHLIIKITIKGGVISAKKYSNKSLRNS